MAEPGYTSALAGLGSGDRPHDREAGVTLRVLEGIGKFALRGDESVGRRAAEAAGFAFADEMLRATRDGERAMLRLGPDEWLLIAVEHDAVAAVLAGSHHALVDVSERMPAIVVEGPSARDVLAGACPLDLHPDVVAPGFASRTVFGKAEIVLECTEGTAFRLHANRSYLEYLWLLFLDLGREFGVSTS